MKDYAELYRTIVEAPPEAQRLMLALLGAKPLIYDLSNYQRWFRLYDKTHEPKLGPEPTKKALLAAAAIVRAEKRPYWEALAEAAEMVSD